MFGDAGHGVIMLTAALWMILAEKSLEPKRNVSEIFNIFFGGRYIVFLMSIFSMEHMNTSAMIWRMTVLTEAPPVTSILVSGLMTNPILSAWILLAIICPSTTALTSVSLLANLLAASSFLLNLKSPWTPSGTISG